MDTVKLKKWLVIVVSKSRIEKYIPEAIKYLEVQFDDNGKTKIPVEYKGYISAMGPGLIQSGLIPTIAFYQNENSSAVRNRKILTDIILKLITNKSEGS